MHAQLTSAVSAWLIDARQLIAGLLLAGFMLPLAAMAETLELAGVSAQSPEGWTAQPPSSAMRLAQFKIAADSGNAEAVVFYFGPQQGGTPEANIARWQSQFTSPQGEPVEPQVQTYTSNDLQITQVLFEGHYARGIGTGPVGAAKPDQALLAAIVEGPQGKLFVQLYGPSRTVKTQQAQFEAFVRSMRPL